MHWHNGSVNKRKRGILLRTPPYASVDANFVAYLATAVVWWVIINTSEVLNTCNLIWSVTKASTCLERHTILIHSNLTRVSDCKAHTLSHFHTHTHSACP